MLDQDALLTSALLTTRRHLDDELRSQNHAVSRLETGSGAIAMAAKVYGERTGRFSLRSRLRSRKHSRFEPHRLEALEIRRLLTGVPTTYTVDLTSDTGASTSSVAGDLRYCIEQANANSNTAGSVIDFSPTVFAAQQTITLNSSLTLSETAGPEVIDGPGSDVVTINANATGSVFVAVPAPLRPWRQ